MLYIMICDDNPLHCDEIKSYILQNMPKELPMQTVVTTNGSQCIEFLKSYPERQWIIFLDIIFPNGENGIQIAQELRRLSPIAQLIFITGEISWCTKIGLADPIYFLTKPIDPQDFRNALQKALRNLQRKHILFHIKGKDFLIALDDILYIERIKRCSYIHTLTGTVRVTEKLDGIFERMQNPAFTSPHKSFLVNLKHVQAITANIFVLDNQEEIPITHLKSTKMKKIYMDYINKLI